MTPERFANWCLAAFAIGFTATVCHVLADYLTRNPL